MADYDEAMLLAFERAERRRYLSRRTIESRRRTLHSLTLWVEAQERSLRSAMSEDIEEWLDSCQLQARSRRVYLSTVRAFYGWALDAGHVQFDPTIGTLAPKVGRTLPNPIPTEDLAMLLRASQDEGEHRMHLWLCLGAYQGLRAVEIAGLSLVDFKRQEDPPYLVVTAAKGNKERAVPLNPRTEEALVAFDPRPRGPIFTLEDGSPISAATVSCYVWRYMHAHGVDSSAHPLRHWFGSNLYAKTRDIRIVQEMLGHSSPQTTAIYVAFNHHAASEAVRDLDVDG